MKSISELPNAGPISTRLDTSLTLCIPGEGPRLLRMPSASANLD